MSDLEYSDDDDQLLEDDDDEMLVDDQDTSDAEMSEDDDGAFTVKPTDTSARKSYDVPHTDLTQQAVEKMMADDVEYIAGILGVDDSAAALLLRHMQWNKEKLIEKYMEDTDAITVAAGVSVPKAKAKAEPSTDGGPLRTTRRANSGHRGATTAAGRASPKPAAPDGFLCPICFDDGARATLALGCGHRFCTGCWREYAGAKIRAEGEHALRCMAEGCGVVAPDAFVRAALADDGAGAARFRELLVRDYVGSKRALKFCPYPSCTHTVACGAAATRASLATVVPTVVCGADPRHVFCFGCGVEGDHRPCVCAVAKMWLRKCADDSETANWIKTNTKECSKCNSTIEKNGGCNHMTCKKCKYEFCWVCMGPWSEHGSSWYSCNRFDEKAGVDARDAQSKSRASLERYLHYYNRWANHEQSAKLSLELYAKTEQKMEAMQVSSALTWIEVQFMKKAVDEVIRCRATLKWTYAMAFYLALGNEKELFEDNQRDLERAVEELSELLEGPIEVEQIAALRQKVTDKAVYVSKRNEIVLEDTANGYQEGRWSWNMSVEGF